MKNMFKSANLKTDNLDLSNKKIVGSTKIKQNDSWKVHQAHNHIAWNVNRVKNTNSMFEGNSQDLYMVSFFSSTCSICFKQVCGSNWGSHSFRNLKSCF